MNRTCLVMLPLLFCGCGPLIMPMTPRLDADQQKMVDGMWDNMLTPAERLDPDLLLDVLCQYSLYQTGVDRLHLTAEKHFKGGWAAMELVCDRVNPEADQFTVTLLDDRGRTMRRERYGRKEIESRLQTSAALRMVPVGKDGKPLPESPEQIQQRQEEQRRQERIEAATQPARLPR